MDQICFDDSNTLSKSQKEPFVETVKKYSQAFQSDLPGYNGAFGPVFANFQFASTARPPSQKVYSPAYGSYGQLLLHQKFQKLKNQGVLIDPLQHDITPTLTHNAWLVKKPSSASIPWDKCQEKDVRLVVGFDKMNKYLKDPPGKVTKMEHIFCTFKLEIHRRTRL